MPFEGLDDRLSLSLCCCSRKDAIQRVATARVGYCLFPHRVTAGMLFSGWIVLFFWLGVIRYRAKKDAMTITTMLLMTP